MNNSPLYRTGDIFTASVQTITNPVNCQGVMGAGLALVFKQRYPEMFSVYQQECETGRLRPGRPTLYRRSTPWILNFPTKDHPGDHSTLAMIEAGLCYLVRYYRAGGITSLALPKLGCGYGGLSWNSVGPLLTYYIGQMDIPVTVYVAPGDYRFPLPSENEHRRRTY